MKILGICGSPRKQGNTEVLLDKALEGARSAGAETEKIFLNDLNIAPIQEAEYENVTKEGFSVIDDGMTAVFKKFSEADAVMIGSPVFFGSLTAQTKTMIDRFQCVWWATEVLGKKVFPERKKGAFLCVGAVDRRDFFDNAKAIVRHFFATINAEYKEEMFFPGLDKKGKALERSDYLEKAFEMGRKLA